MLIVIYVKIYNGGLFFLTQMLGSACWVFFIGLFFIICTHVLGNSEKCFFLIYFFNPNAGFSLLANCIGFIFTVYTNGKPPSHTYPALGQFSPMLGRLCQTG